MLNLITRRVAGNKLRGNKANRAVGTRMQFKCTPRRLPICADSFDRATVRKSEIDICAKNGQLVYHDGRRFAPAKLSIHKWRSLYVHRSQQTKTALQLRVPRVQGGHKQGIYRTRSQKTCAFFTGCNSYFLSLRKKLEKRLHRSRQFVDFAPHRSDQPFEGTELRGVELFCMIMILHFPILTRK